MSHSATSETLLSAILNALTCSSVKPLASMQGTSAMLRLLAALYLVCPLIITEFSSITIGTLNPNSLIELATNLTALSSWIVVIWIYFINVFINYFLSHSFFLSKQ